MPALLGCYAGPLKKGPISCPETSVPTNLRCKTYQKREDLSLQVIRHQQNVCCGPELSFRKCVFVILVRSCRLGSVFVILFRSSRFGCVCLWFWSGSVVSEVCVLWFWSGAVISEVCVCDFGPDLLFRKCVCDFGPELSFRKCVFVILVRICRFGSVIVILVRSCRFGSVCLCGWPVSCDRNLLMTVVCFPTHAGVRGGGLRVLVYLVHHQVAGCQEFPFTKLASSSSPARCPPLSPVTRPPHTLRQAIEFAATSTASWLQCTAVGCQLKTWHGSYWNTNILDADMVLQPRDKWNSFHSEFFKIQRSSNRNLEVRAVHYWEC
jgi:hypothetical protein